MKMEICEKNKEYVIQNCYYRNFGVMIKKQFAIDCGELFSISFHSEQTDKFSV